MKIRKMHWPILEIQSISTTNQYRIPIQSLQKPELCVGIKGNAAKILQLDFVAVNLREVSNKTGQVGGDK